MKIIKTLSLLFICFLFGCAVSPRIDLGKQTATKLKYIAFEGNPYKIQRVLRGKKKVEVKYPVYDHPAASMISESILTMPLIHYLDQSLTPIANQLTEKVHLDKAQLYSANSFETWKVSQTGANSSMIGMQYGAIGSAVAYLVNQLDLHDDEFKATFIYEEDSFVCHVEGRYADQAFAITKHIPRKSAEVGLKQMLIDCKADFADELGKLTTTMS